MAVKIRLKGHESFSLREGWLRKGLSAINEKNQEISDDSKDVFSTDEAVEVLGVGSNMVKSIKYWLQVCGLTDDLRTKKGRKISVLSENFGTIINEYDGYFEEIFTLWLLHYKLATNIENATSWYLFFNDYDVDEFTKNDMFDGLKIGLSKLDPAISISERSLHDDCNCIIKTYYLNSDDLINPEENLYSPLAELGLLDRKVSLDKKELFIKRKPRMDSLNPMVILYVIIDNLKDEMNTTVEKLLNEKCNIGKVFNLDRIMINNYLDILENKGYITVNRTAGLDTVYINKKINSKDILVEYYVQLGEGTK